MSAEGLGGLVAEGLEAGAKKLTGTAPAEGMLKDVEHFFSFDSAATGKSGKLLKDSVYKGLYPELDKQLSIETKKASQSGLTKSPVEIRQAAMEKAKDNTYGIAKQHLATIMEQVRKEHGPAKVAQLTDYMGIVMQEHAYTPSGTASKVSETASDLAKHPLLKAMGIPFGPSPYTPVNSVERALGKYTTGTLAPLTAAWHATQGILNSSVNAHASSIVKAIGDLWGTGYQASKSQLIAQNALGHELFDEYAQQYKFRQGIIAKFAPNSIGAFLHDNYLLPGLSTVKAINSVYAAMVGKYEAHWAASELLQGGASGMKRGAFKLRDLGIRWQDVQARGGLTQDHIRVAQQRMVQQIMHSESGGARARFVATTPYGRTISMFHNFATMQGNMVTKRIFEMLRGQHDPLMTIQMLAAIGIAFPTAGFFVNDMLKAARGKTDHPLDDFGKQEKDYLEGKNFADGMMMVAKMAMGGVLYDYANAAARQKLQAALLGPVVNAPVEMTQDAIKASKAGGGPHKADQFKRDLLRDLPSFGLGATIAEHAYPTQAERNAALPMTARRVKARAAAARRKARKQ
jgi:hypothetical protein